MRRSGVQRPGSLMPAGGTGTADGRDGARLAVMYTGLVSVGLQQAEVGIDARRTCSEYGGDQKADRGKIGQVLHELLTIAVLWGYRLAPSNVEL